MNRNYMIIMLKRLPSNASVHYQYRRVKHTKYRQNTAKQKRTNRLSKALRLGLDRIETGATTLVHIVHVETSVVVEAHVVAAADGRTSSRGATGEAVGGDARLVRTAVAAL